MLRLLLILGFFLAGELPLFCQSKKICITVDDLPVVNYGIEDHLYLKGTITDLVHTANKYDVPMIGFVNEGKLYTNNQLDSFKVGLLTYWIQNGYELGNHTFSHMDYNAATIETFTEDIVKGEMITKELMKTKNQSFMYFRHPYLHSGATKAKSDSLSIILDSLHYIVSPVTIDNSDYIFADAYHKAYLRKDKPAMKYIGKEYVMYMERVLLYSEALSENLLHKRIAQTLLIHASLLNADYLDELIVMYKRHQYTFVSQSEVLKDEIYSHPILVYSKRGNSWLCRWADKETVDGLKLQEPEVSQKIIALTK